MVERPSDCTRIAQPFSKRFETVKFAEVNRIHGGNKKSWRAGSVEKELLNDCSFLFCQRFALPVVAEELGDGLGAEWCQLESRNLPLGFGVRLQEYRLE